MAKFMFSANSLTYHKGKRDCKNCPHLHNSLLSAEGSQFNPLERFEVRYDFCLRSKRYPTQAIAEQAMSLLCDLRTIFKRHRRELTMSEYIVLSMKYDIKFIDNKCFINDKLYAEIVQVC